MRKLLLITMLTTIIISCNTVNNKKGMFLNKEHIDTLSFFSDVECQNSVATLGLSNDYIKKFIHQVTLNESDIEKVVLVFYKEEGEVINLYKSAIITSRDETKIVYSLNDSELEFEEIKFDIDSLIDKIEEKDIPTNRHILILGVEEKTDTCSFFKNVKRIATYEKKILFE